MKRSFILIVSMLIVLSIFLVHAQDNNSTDDNQNSTYNSNQTNDDSNETDDDSNQTDDDSNKTLTGPWETRCQAMNHRVAGRLRQYEENRDKHYNNLRNLAGVLEKVISRAKEKNYDTAALEDDLVKLNELITILENDYEIFIEKLGSTRNFTCGHSEGQYKSALNDSKEQLRVVKEDAETIKEFFGSTVKEDIAALKEQIKLSFEERKKAAEEERSIKIEERQKKVAEKEAEMEQRKIEFENRLKEREENMKGKEDAIKSRIMSSEEVKEKLVIRNKVREMKDSNKVEEESD